MQDLTSDTAIRAFRRSIDQFASLLRRADGQADAARPVPGLRWSVGEVAAHVLSGIRSYRASAAGGDPPWKTFATSADDNDALVAATPERDLTSIADALPLAADDFADLCSTHGDAMVRWHENNEIPATVLAGLAAGEMLIHGRDIAHAINVPWTITRDDAAVVTAAAMHILPHFVIESAARSFSATYELRLTHGPRYARAFTNGALTTRPGSPENPDCRIAADPRAFMLVAYGRTALWQAIATANMLAWGRRPWLALRLLPMLRKP